MIDTQNRSRAPIVGCALASSRSRRPSQQRLDEWYAAAARDEITPAGLAAIERTLLAEIEDAERRAEQVEVPPLVRKLVGPGVEERWERLTIGQQREVVSLLLELRVGKTYRGARKLDPARLGNSRWRGDSQTWGAGWSDSTVVPSRRSADTGLL